VWLSGFLLAGSLGCSRKEVRSPLTPEFPQGAQPVTGVPVAKARKPFWERSPAPPAPVEVAAEPPRKGPMTADTQVAFADVRLEAALDEKTPPANKEALLDAARQGYQKALQQDPKSKAARLGLARYYSRTGDREKAVEEYKKYLTQNPTDKEVAHEVATAHARWKDWAGAVAWCQFTLKIDPENLGVRKTMAFCLARSGQWEPAFQVMCEVMPEAQARYLMARVLEHQNQPDACRQQLQLAIQADPNCAEAREFLAELDGVTMPGLERDPNNPVRVVDYKQQP
jgi:tetratricopeptide (TPR) repeat protein